MLARRLRRQHNLNPAFGQRVCWVYHAGIGNGFDSWCCRWKEQLSFILATYVFSYVATYVASYAVSYVVSYGVTYVVSYGVMYAVSNVAFYVATYAASYVVSYVSSYVVSDLVC